MSLETGHGKALVFSLLLRSAYIDNNAEPTLQRPTNLETNAHATKHCPVASNQVDGIVGASSEGMTQVNASQWLVWHRRNTPARVRLFGVPYAGVGASAYRLWAAALPPEVEFCAIQLPGRENRLREPALTRIDTIVEHLVHQLTPHLDRPYAVFGHSMGAVIASDLCRKLRERGEPSPVHLFLSGRRAPGIPDPDPPLASLSDDAFVEEIERRYGGIPAEVKRDREIMALLLPGLRADMAALEWHQPTGFERIACPVTVYGGIDDPRAPREHLEAWRENVDSSFRVRVFEGNHFYLNTRRAELLADISATLSPQLRETMPVERAMVE